MKRIGYLFEKVISVDNLYTASRKAQRGKRKRRDIKEWNKDIDSNIQELYNDLKNKTYKVPEYYDFIVKDSKERIISRLPFRDRIVHHALMNGIEPILKKSLISQTYSCIKKRGILKCSLNLRKDLKDCNNVFVLKLDIRKFYPSVDNEILKSILRSKFKDEGLLWLIDTIIDSSKGLKLGNYTSQWFANYYLNKFDHWIKQTKSIKSYHRYCDDIVILSNNKEFLRLLKNDINSYLKNNLKLEISKWSIKSIEKGIDFVGYVHYPTHTLLRKSIKKRFVKMIKTNKNIKSINSYKGWITHCNGINLWNKYINK